MEDKKFCVIGLDETISINVSGHYMQRVKYLGDFLIKQYGQERFIAFLKKMVDEDGKPQEELEEHLLTISALLTEFELTANKQEKVRWVSEKEMAENLVKSNPDFNES